MPLDFSKLDRLAYRDFDTPEAQRTRDDLIEKGFTVVEDKANPFTGPETAQQPQSAPPRTEATPAPSTPPRPSKQPPRPFKSIEGLDYRAFYGDLYRWHERYTALVLQDSNAWDEAAEAWTELCNRYNANDNPYVQQVLVSVFEEVEREYKAVQGDS